MSTVENKILREQVQEGFWELSEENLERGLCYMGLCRERRSVIFWSGWWVSPFVIHWTK